LAALQEARQRCNTERSKQCCSAIYVHSLLEIQQTCTLPPLSLLLLLLLLLLTALFGGERPESWRPT
jgi:hypothetical protein